MPPLPCARFPLLGPAESSRGRGVLPKDRLPFVSRASAAERDSRGDSVASSGLAGDSRRLPGLGGGGGGGSGGPFGGPSFPLLTSGRQRDPGARRWRAERAVCAIGGPWDAGKWGTDKGSVSAYLKRSGGPSSLGLQCQRGCSPKRASESCWQAAFAGCSAWCLPGRGNKGRLNGCTESVVPEAHSCMRAGDIPRGCSFRNWKAFEYHVCYRRLWFVSISGSLPLGPALLCSRKKCGQKDKNQK